MEKIKGTVKRYIGKLEINFRDGQATSAIVDGLMDNGYEVVTYPIEDMDGRYLGETIEIYLKQ